MNLSYTSKQYIEKLMKFKNVNIEMNGDLKHSFFKIFYKDKRIFYLLLKNEESCLYLDSFLQFFYDTYDELFFDFLTYCFYKYKFKNEDDTENYLNYLHCFYLYLKDTFDTIDKEDLIKLLNYMKSLDLFISIYNFKNYQNDFLAQIIYDKFNLKLKIFIKFDKLNDVFLTLNTFKNSIMGFNTYLNLTKVNEDY